MTAAASPRTSPLVYGDDVLRRVLRETRAIAVVGASAKWVRPSNFVMKYLQGKGYRIHPINPGIAGNRVLEEVVYAGLGELAGAGCGPIEMVDVFRSSDAAAEVVDDAIRLKDVLGISCVWMQIGVRNDQAARRAEDAGLTVIMDRCVKIEYGRLCGELGWQGVNSGIISAKRPRLRP